jgi:mRNA-degrading endonuclease RelE of RelBE toxin-antitoxin system
MVKRTREPVESYRVWIEPEVHVLRNELPGKVRQRIKREIDHLADRPRPSSSLDLDTSDLGLPSGLELRRIRLEHWRIIYAINDQDHWVWILAIHKRPPYNYEDLSEIVSKFTE